MLLGLDQRAIREVMDREVRQTLLDLSRDDFADTDLKTD
jgi:hypothetical protein